MSEATERGKEVTVQEVIDGYDIRFIKRGSDPEEIIDIPFIDVMSLIARYAVAQMKQAEAVAEPLIITPKGGH